MARAEARPPLHVYAYGPDAVEEHHLATAAEAKALTDRFPVVWANVNAVTDERVVADIGATFGLHPLALEDVRNTHQRPKVEGYGDHLYVVLHMMRLLDADEDNVDDDGLPPPPQLDTEQLSLFLGDGWVVTFQEREGDVFSDVRHRIGIPASRVRQRGSDYLAYKLADALVDCQFPTLTKIGDRLDVLDELISEDPRPAVRNRLQDVKANLRTLRRLYGPQRDALGGLGRWEAPFIQEETRTFLRDVVDHAIRSMEILESQREYTADLRDLYLAEVNTRQSEVMQFLTIIATIFIPLTFVAGVYGMNFLFMPELAWTYGYPATLLFMTAVAVGLLLFFRRRGWL